MMKEFPFFLEFRIRNTQFVKKMHLTCNFTYLLLSLNPQGEFIFETLQPPCGCNESDSLIQTLHLLDPTHVSFGHVKM